MACLFCMKVADGHRPLLSLQLIFAGQARGKMMCQLIKTQGSATETITLDKLAAFGLADVSSGTLHRCYDANTYDAGSPTTNTSVIHLLMCTKSRLLRLNSVTWGRVTVTFQFQPIFLSVFKVKQEWMVISFRVYSDSKLEMMSLTSCTASYLF